MGGVKILPYIENTSSQYIDTGIIPFKGIDFQFDIEYTDVKVIDNTASIPTFGVCGSTLGWESASFYVLYRNDSKILNVRIWAENNVNTQECPYLQGRFQIKMSYSRWALIQYEKEVAYAKMKGVSKIPNRSIYIGNKNDSSNNPHTMDATYKLYGCKIYDGNELIRNFVPALFCGRKGMFETVNRKFYEFKNFIYNG